MFVLDEFLFDFPLKISDVFETICYRNFVSPIILGTVLKIIPALNGMVLLWATELCLQEQRFLTLSVGSIYSWLEVAMNSRKHSSCLFDSTREKVEE